LTITKLEPLIRAFSYIEELNKPSFSSARGGQSPRSVNQEMSLNKAATRMKLL